MKRGSDPIRDAMWDEGILLIGKENASLIGRLYKLSGNDALAVLDEVRLTKHRYQAGLISNPVPFLIAAFQEHKPEKRA